MESTLTVVWRWWLAMWPHVAAATVLTINVAASIHAILLKRDTRSTIGWVGLIWFSPVFGAIAYAVLGVNRIRSRATQLRAGQARVTHALEPAVAQPNRLREAVGPDDSPLRSLVTLVGNVTGRPLVDGNTIIPLDGGNEAYPEMLESIDAASRSVAIASYIFDNDPTGKVFAEALGRAVARGVEVRVLIDGIGSTYTFPPITSVLANRGVRVERFLPTSVPFYFPYANLRNHRKIMVVDGRIGFTGGLNIRDGCWLAHNPAHPVRDTHFRLEGPVVTQLLEVFIEDWAFASGETLGGPAWQPVLTPAGTMLARGIRFGPDDPDIGRIKLVLVGALAAAQKSVRIMTPYFLPDDAIFQALDVAAMRGVQVDIVLPEENNLALVGWASDAMLWQALGRGCNVWMSSPPFEHTKLMVVDSSWAMFGSGNWDERSMRLNFEFNVETYDRSLAARLDERIAAVMGRARRRTLADVDGRSLPVRLRDGVARLLSPYL
ncbi:MAG: PLDc N-terminal domain-containing protein [Planctomycetia bacterium]|nr:PLDc N-terminal domain-containing protein [Planctomycetia bacterium]